MRPVPVWSVVLAAVAAALVVWVVAVPIAGVELALPGPPDGSSGSPAVTTVGPAAIVVTAALATLAAWPVRAAFRRRLARPAEPASAEPEVGPASAPRTATNLGVVAPSAVATRPTSAEPEVVRASAPRSATNLGVAASGQPGGGRGRPAGWWVTCGVLLVVSLSGPAGAASVAAVCALAAMHVAVASVIVVGLDPRRAGARAKARTTTPTGSGATSTDTATHGPTTTQPAAP